MANYKDFENALDITEQMYDLIPLLSGKVIIKAILDSSEEFKSKERKRKETRSNMSFTEGAIHDMLEFNKRR